MGQSGKGRPVRNVVRGPEEWREGGQLSEEQKGGKKEKKIERRLWLTNWKREDPQRKRRMMNKEEAGEYRSAAMYSAALEWKIAIEMVL